MTAFHSIAGQQQFLAIVDSVRRLVSRDWAHQSLFVRSANRTGKGHANLRWDPGANRNRSLMSSNPSELGTEVDAPREWLAFRALPLFPTVPVGTVLRTTGFRRSSNETLFSWPLWREPASLRAVGGLVRLRLKIDSNRGILPTAASQLIRNGYYRNFGSGSVSA
ncbi:MAG: type I-G CRISPR-associated protein, Cas3-extension family [Archangium sp.]